MFLPELYSGPQNNNSLEASRSFVEKHDCSQSKYPARIGKTCEGGVSSFCYCVPSSYCLCQSQHALIDDNIIYKGDSCPASAYAHPLNAVNVISNSFPIDHENSIEKNENNSLEINPAAYLREQSEPSALNLDEGGNIQDFIEEKYYSFSTAVNNKGKRKPRNTEKGSQISGPSGSMDRHSKVLTSKGPRDRRIRLSVGTAIKLYFLQESLGFDQPSKAVEWLIKKSQAAIRELPQVSSISCSNISPHVDSDRSAVCVSCHQTGDLSTLSQDNTCTASGDCVVNSHDQILSANACIGQKSSTATTIESSNRGSIVQGEKREQRSKVMSSVSSRITRTTANGVRQKEFRAKAREWARERTRKKEKRYNQDSGIYGLLRPSYVPLQFPAFSLQDNSTSASSLNMINETTEANSNRDDFLHSFMFPNPSNLCSSSSLCISSPPAKIQSSLASVHYSSTQQQDISIQSTEVLSSSDPEVFPVTSDSFPQAVATANNCSSLCVFCRYPPDHAHLNPSNLYGSCREESIEMPGIYDSGLQTSFESQSTLNNEIFQELQVNEEIPCLKSSNEYVPSRIIVSNPSAYHGIFGLLQ